MRSRTPGQQRNAAVAVVAAAALVVAGCDTASSDPPDPDAADPPDTGPPDSSQPDDPEPAPLLLDDDTAIDLYIAWRGTVHSLPPTPPNQVDVDGVDGIVVPNSEAAEWITHTLADAAEVGLIDRGDIHAEALNLTQDPTGGTADAVLCVSHDVELTELETGDPIETPDLPVDAYLQFDVTYRLIDDDWLIESSTAPEPGECVPPSIEEAVTANWEAYVAALVDWAGRGSPGDDIGELADLTTGRTLEGIRDSPGAAPGSWSEGADLDYDVKLHQATRTRVGGSWCFDPARNPEAGFYEADGSFTPMTELTTRRFETAAWELVDGSWLLAERDASVSPDHPDAPEEHRCF